MGNVPVTGSRIYINPDSQKELDDNLVVPLHRRFHERRDSRAGLSSVYVGPLIQQETDKVLVIGVRGVEHFRHLPYARPLS